MVGDLRLCGILSGAKNASGWAGSTADTAMLPSKIGAVLLHVVLCEPLLPIT